MTLLRFTGLLATLILLVACSSPESRLQEAIEKNTEEAYQEFLAGNPGGELAAQARTRLNALRDAADWAAAQQANDPTAMQRYLATHPDGAAVDIARRRLADMERAEAWQAAQQAGTREAIDAFVARYPDSPEARLVQLQPPVEEAAPPAASTAPPPTSPRLPAASAKPVAGRYHVQLGAFQSADGAKAARVRLQKQFSALFAGELQIAPPLPGGRDAFYRVRTAAMDEAGARQLCAKLKSAGGGCVVAR